MKKILFISFIVFISSGCGVSRKISLLEQCRYDLKSADSVYFAGRDVSRQIKTRTFDLGSIPELAIGLIRKDIPLSARLNIGINNPGSKAIEINQFDYIILFKGQELVNGTTERRINVNPIRQKYKARDLFIPKGNRKRKKQSDQHKNSSKYQSWE